MFFKKNTVTFTLAVAGMKCEMCAARVKKAAESIRGVTAEIDLAAGTAVVTAPEKTDPAAVAAEITKAGFAAEVR